MAPRKTTGAFTPARDPAPHLRRAAEDTARGRVVVPQLEQLARGLDPNALTRIRMQVEPGERVAIYRRQGEVRVLITGPQRLYRTPPAAIGRDHDWRRLGVVEITDDGEQALPEPVS